VGLYQIRVTASLDDPLNTQDNSLVWDLTVKANPFRISLNSAPIFATHLVKQTVDAGSSTNYKLPQTIDNDGDNVKV